jgi:membrane protease YdiL (CAAX protease family)
MAPRTWILVLILIPVLSLLCQRLQGGLRGLLARRPLLIFAAPALLTVLFVAVAAWAGGSGVALAGLVAVYLFLPTCLAYVQGPGPPGRPSWLDFGIILLLWLPIEFGAGASLIPRAAQGFLHSVAYGVAILLALVLFLGFRAWEGMKYRLPAGRDLLYAIAGFVASAPVLILVGRAVEFIPPWHAPATLAAARLLTKFLIILVGTALPEEILFRCLIQNGLMQRYGATTPILLLASFIFGCAHLDNGPQPLPNWRYLILATIAGFAYGKVFQKSSSVWGSATLHALVDWTKHVFF